LRPQAQGEAHAISPDARFRHPAVRSLHASSLSASCLRSLPRPARSAWASPLAGHRWSCG